MSDSASFGRESRAGVRAGGRFMTAPEMKAAGVLLGVSRATLYFRGRAGALGDVTSTVAASLFSMFPPSVVVSAWETSRELSAAAATQGYSEACSSWGRARLSELDTPLQLCELAERVVDAAEPSALPLFAAWRAQALPEDSLARAAHNVNRLRELRGGLYFAALRANGLDIPLAVFIDPTKANDQMRLTGWTVEEIASLSNRATALVDGFERRENAENDTNVAFGLCCDVLTAGERDSLAACLASFEEVTRAAA